MSKKTRSKKFRLPADVLRKLDRFSEYVHFRRVLLESKPDTELGALTAAMVGEPEPRRLEVLEAAIERMATELVALGYTHQVNLVRQNAHRSSWDFGPGEHEAYLQEYHHTPPTTPASRNVGTTEYPSVRKLLENL